MSMEDGKPELAEFSEASESAHFRFPCGDYTYIKVYAQGCRFNAACIETGRLFEVRDNEEIILIY